MKFDLKSTAKRVQEYLRNTRLWAWTTFKYVWIYLLGLAATLVLDYLLAPEWLPRLSIASATIQLLGLVILLGRVGNVWTEFSGTTLWNGLKKYVRDARNSFPKWRESIVTEHVAGGALLGGVSAMGAAGTLHPAPTSLADRVAQLETSVGELRNQVSTDKQRVTEELSTIKKAIEDEQRAREEVDNRFQQRLARAMLSTLPQEILATCWIFTGIALPLFRSAP